MKTNPQTTDPKLLKRLRMELETIEIQKKKNTAIVQSSYRAWKWMAIQKIIGNNTKKIICIIFLSLALVILAIVSYITGSMPYFIIGVVSALPSLSLTRIAMRVAIKWCASIRKIIKGKFALIGSAVLLLGLWAIACYNNTMLGAIIGSIIGIIAGPIGVLISCAVGIVIDYFF